jgi:hypothetical protein
MGLTLQFVIGNKQEIIYAVEKEDLDFFEKLECQNHLADFSLHIIPNDLNLLIAAATELKEIQLFGLREYLDTEIHYFDSEERGAYLVDSIIVILFSDFQKSDASELTTKWFKKMDVEHNEVLEVSNKAIDSVERLIIICKEAEILNLDLVHIWNL